MMKSIQNEREKNPSTLNHHPSSFTFGPSVQVDLFNYLKPHQREAMKPYLRLIKRPYQEKLCISLLDFLEGHGLDTLSEPVLALFQEEIVQVCNLRPLASSKFQVSGCKSIGTIIKQLFG